MDEFVNTIFGGSPRETVSSHVGKLADAGNPIACRFCAFLAAILGPQHCHNSETPDDGKQITGPYSIWFDIVGAIILVLIVGYLWGFSEGAVILDFGRWK